MKIEISSTIDKSVVPAYALLLEYFMKNTDNKNKDTGGMMYVNSPLNTNLSERITSNKTYASKAREICDRLRGLRNSNYSPRY